MSSFLCDQKNCKHAFHIITFIADSSTNVDVTSSGSSYTTSYEDNTEIMTSHSGISAPGEFLVSNSLQLVYMRFSRN